MGQKITLAEALESGAIGIRVYCHRTLESRLCNHDHTFDTVDLIKRYGGEIRIDDIPFRCAVCGALKDKIDVRPYFGKRGPGGLRET